ncbi:rod shape-determining protein MreC [Deinococcus deserti]|uniref:Cell shape-determining protein MreC n=1 Tax=Deinococcus deserti (strain DSM 17065 / CIP 109153 / LMG 22923 / VCD115) TaxID=546414 RepID=C1CUW6_DEIDV|nr:rod shape-determining protein MreC [Deinococcus deserti]ACO45983.1 putative Rod shape-determining protein MreC [Deinococcus deserti VCD115]
MKERPRLLLVFVGLLLISLLLLRFQAVAPTALRAATAPVSRIGVVAADNLRRAYSTLFEERRLNADLRRLQAQNDELRQRNEMLTREVMRLRQLEKITATQAPNALGIAQVIAVDPSALLARLTLNKGKRDGVRLRMPVTVPGGLVGQVTGVSESQSTVVALVDPESSVGVTLQGSKGGRGLAHGLPPDRMKAEFSRSVPVKKGDVLVTSSIGGLYPVGIRVGTVEKVLPLGPNDVNRSVIVKPAIDVGVIEDVTILEGV